MYELFLSMQYLVTPSTYNGQSVSPNNFIVLSSFITTSRELLADCVRLLKKSAINIVCCVGCVEIQIKI